MGLGSAVFHPESSRVARMASGGRHGLAQSLFQVGGNTGSAIGPLRGRVRRAAARARRSVAWFSVAALLAILVLWRVGGWYRRAPRAAVAAIRAAAGQGHPTLSPGQVRLALGVLIVLIFSKYIYLTSITSYYTFYLIHHFGVSVQSAQLHLFAFLARGGRRHDHRRSRGRPVRPEAGDLVLDSRRAAVHARAART